ncbi:hypothetical protein N857_gp070 [Mycobacterium phage Wanda]|uniref:hypothetical protein n=1 Tax=Mycobacterium phage Wanda TaxID=1340713 RepID=UPI0003881D38|nr:hypothetical protein N857_gp070 [Mycobacterium phage Wanda]AGT11774.1 hypothetical protein PBI_WANDA_70 [Mycobacterium phage Wanda]
MTERWTLADPALKAVVTKRPGPGNLNPMGPARVKPDTRSATERAKLDIANLWSGGHIGLHMAQWGYRVVEQLFTPDTVYASIAPDNGDLTFYWRGGDRSVHLDLFIDHTCWMAATRPGKRFKHYSRDGEIADWMRDELADFSAAVEAANPNWREQEL